MAFWKARPLSADEEVEATICHSIFVSLLAFLAFRNWSLTLFLVASFVNPGD